MRSRGIPVLMYHALEDEKHPAGAKNQGEQLYIVSVDNFREQMLYLHTQGFQAFLIQELLELDNWPQKAVVITFDDGHESNYILALPILQEYGFKAEFFITTGWTDTQHFLTREQIVHLYKAGMSIGSHSVTHRYFDDLTDEEIEQELKKSQRSLEKITASKVCGISLPGGRLKLSPNKKAKLNNYKVVCTSSPGILRKESLNYLIPRFTIKQNTSLKYFSRIVHLESNLMIKIKTKESMLYYAKKLLGNNLYDNIRRSILNSYQNR